jgi:hypothetical protein
MINNYLYSNAYAQPSMNIIPTMRNIDTSLVQNVRVGGRVNIEPASYQGGYIQPPTGHTRDSLPTMITDFGMNRPQAIFPVNNLEQISHLNNIRRIASI